MVDGRVSQIIKLLIQYTIPIRINNVIRRAAIGRDFYIAKLAINTHLFHYAIFAVNNFYFRLR